MKTWSRNCLYTAAALAVLLVSAGRAGEPAGPPLTSLEGKRIGVLEGSVSADALREKLGGFTVLYFMTASDLTAAVRSGNVDAVVAALPVLAVAAAGDPGLTLVRDRVLEGNYALAVRKNQRDLGDRISEVIRELNQDGTLRRLHEKWVTGPEAGRVLPPVREQGEAPALRYGVADIGRPFVYQDADEKLIGYDIELGMIIAERLGMNLVLQEMLFAHLIQSLNGNLVDVIGSAITVTPDREEEVYFTAPYFRGGSAAMVRTGR